MTMPDDRPVSPEEWTIEVCNDCGGLVGWWQYRDGCCIGGMVCHRTSSRFLAVAALSAARPSSPSENGTVAEYPAETTIGGTPREDINVGAPRATTKEGR